MNQTDTQIETPITDRCFDSPDRGGIRARTWKVKKLVDTSRRLERDLAKANADKAVLVEALQAISATPSAGPLAAADMQNVANRALFRVQA